MGQRVYESILNQKRTVPGNNRLFAKILGTVLLFLFLLPYIITSLFGNVNHSTIGGTLNLLLNGLEKDLADSSIYIENTTTAGRERLPLEIYLLDKLSRSINPDYQLEALKAQAILLRTALMEELWENSGNIRGTVRINDHEYGQGLLNEDIVIAIASTRGVFLTYDDKPAKVAYFAVSNGRTRDGSEAFGQGVLPYFKAVDCNRDFLAENFTSQKTMTKNEFTAAIESHALISLTNDFSLDDISINRDLSGYVIDVTINNQTEAVVLSGEECRQIWGLSSSSFSIDENRNRIVFSVRGIGHGLGMSQFAANEMAKNGNDYISILEYFFSGLMLTKFE
ncbi:MAG: SpoIID/LytB domain-containing protein [Lachnospiraceae bacterium]|nr:SpoIID/LytB domain-containing protein [Lachnospiraceae bacterium]